MLGRTGRSLAGAERREAVAEPRPRRQGAGVRLEGFEPPTRGLEAAALP